MITIILLRIASKKKLSFKIFTLVIPILIQRNVKIHYFLLLVCIISHQCPPHWKIQLLLHSHTKHSDCTHTLVIFHSVNTICIIYSFYIFSTQNNFLKKSSILSPPLSLLTLPWDVFIQKCLLSQAVGPAYHQEATRKVRAVFGPLATKGINF